MKKKRITIKEVAEAANVSAMTVSNVLNKRTESVSLKTKYKVEQEIIRLNYRRQTAARNLRAAHQFCVGMIVVDKSPKFLTDFFTTELVTGLANVLNTADYTMTIQGINGNNLVNSNIMRSLEVGGLCVMLSGTNKVRNKVIKQLQSLEQPLIIFQQEVNEINKNLCVIRQNDFNGGQLIGKYLLSKDVQEFLIIKPKQVWPALDYRINGFKQEIIKLNENVSIKIIQSKSESFVDVQTTLNKYLKENPLPGAIFGCNDQIAYASIILLREKGYSIPYDIRVVGFNGFDAHRNLEPNLTTVISNAYEMGQIAGKKMLNYFSTGYFLENDVILPVHLSIGATA